MFQRLFSWIKGVWHKMIGKSSVKQATGVESVISNDMSTAITLWSQMYNNKASWLSDEIKSLNLAATVAAEISKMVTIEMKAVIEGSGRAEYLNTEFTKNVLDKIRTAVEFGAAKGGLIFKPYIENGRLAVDFIQADQFFPAKFDANGDLLSCVFVDQRQIGDKWYTRLEYHEMFDTYCVIRNLAFTSSSRDTLGQQVGLSSLSEWAELLPEATIQNIDKPLFSYFRYPLANNIDPTSPIGVSCFSRSVDLIRQADELWSNLIWEFESGKRALYIDELAFGKDADGKPLLPKNRLYRTISASTVDKEFFEAWSPEFREASILSGLDAILKKIEFNSGLAYGTISDPQVEVKTATEIKISKQRTYTTVVDTQKALEDALEHLVYAMDVWATLGNIAPRGTYKVVFEFDDSVIVDKAEQMAQDRQTVSMGAMPKYIFLMRNYGMSEADAKKMIAEVTAEQPEITFQDNPV
jgi:A118 family predicted phage portal protein